MTSPRLPLVKAQRSFLSGIRPSREQHGPKVKVTAPPKKNRKLIKENGQQSRKSLDNGIYHSLYVQVKNVQFSLQI
jgi:hypothetical protein